MIRLSVSVGCPCGIGPEVTVAALAAPLENASVVLRGDRGAIEDAARLRGVDLSALVRVTVAPSSDLPRAARAYGKPGVSAGSAQLKAIDDAVADVLGGRSDAIVTGPVSKLAITRAGTDFLGHTEYLAAAAGVARVVMLFAGPRLRTSLVTTHVSIRALPSAITAEAVTETVVMTARSMSREFGVARPRVAVTGLNPHAGEGGLLGAEERDVIADAVNVAKTMLGEGFRVVGPIAAEAAFREAKEAKHDVVVAMFHDQATIASKLLDFGDAVNVTLGLPFVRTSVDHGTGYDIAGKGVADARGMRAALELAVSMASQRLSR